MDQKQNPTRSSSDEIDLGKLFGLLIDDRFKIIAITFFFTLIGIVYALFATPIYKADALIQVEEKKGGMSSLLSENVGELFAGDSSATTEIEIIKSRMILEDTVNSLNLTTIAEPIYFPIFGKGLARRSGSENIIKISSFDVPNYLKPIDLPLNYELVITNASSFEVVDINNEQVILQGQIGELVNQQGYKIFVQQLKGNVGDRFTVQKINQLDAIETLKTNLSISERGKQSGILQLSYTGENKQKITEILDSVSQNYFLQNVKRNSAEAEKSLSFLEDHLPSVKLELDTAENQLNLYRQSNESIDLTLEAQATLKGMVQLESQLNELSFKESELSQKFTKDHPAYKSLLEQKNVLQTQKHQLELQVQNMPETQREILRMTRDVEVNQQIYVHLLNRVQELNILKAGTVGNVRILDNARAYTRAVEPKKSLIVMLAMMLGAMFAIALTLIRAALHKGIENPDEIEELGLSVYASIPDSKEQHLLNVRDKRKSKKHAQEALLALDNPADLAIEALRSLRTSIHFAMMEAKNNIVTISGPAPSVGKSFVTSNFGAILAQSGQRVLVIDGDLRKGHLIRYFNAESEQGLSEVITGKLSTAQAIQSTKVENLDVMVRGQVPPNPSELLMHSRFSELLEKVSKKYDIVLIDTPPVLAVTDPSIIAALAGTTLMVGRFGQNTLKEIEVANERFAKSGIEVKGFILNAVEKKASNSYGYGYGYYNYSYESEK